MFAAALLGGCGSLDNPEVPLTGTTSASDVPAGSLGSSSSTSPASGSGPSSGGGSSANGVDAPTLVQPPPGGRSDDSQPTLTIQNARTDDGSSPAYDFQVASDADFNTIVAERIGLPEGQNGTTSWRVDVTLSEARHFWRARGIGARGPGPYSPTSDFFIGSSGTSSSPGSPTPSPNPTPTPSGGAFLVDSLIGSSVGQVVGGRFTSKGWQVLSRGDFIRYRIPTTTSGFVEWENIGLTRLNPRRDLYTLFGMWDPSAGDYRENPYRVHLRKLDTQGHNPPYLRLRFISGGDQRDVGFDFLDWVPNRTYQWRVEWGPGGSGNEARVLLDGRPIIRTGYGPAYRPSEHWVELGVEERAESIVGVTYRNVRIGGR